MNNNQLRALTNTQTYIGLGKSSEVTAIGAGKWAWRFIDPWYGGVKNAYVGTLEECEQVKEAYDNPRTDHPF